MTNENEKASFDSNPVLASVIARIASSNASADAAAKLAAAVKNDLKALEPFDLVRPKEQSNMNAFNKQIQRRTVNRRSPILKFLSVAAAIAVLVLVVFTFLPGKSSAFAKMQHVIAHLNTIQCNSAHFRPGEAVPYEKETIWIQEPNWVRSKCNDEHGDAFIVIDLATGDCASWWTATSHGMIEVLPDVQLMKDVLCQFVEVLRGASLDEINQVDRYRSEDNVWLAEFEFGTTLIDGPTVLVNVVVNEVTSLPIEISFYDDKGNLIQNFTDLSFDQRLDPDLFLIELPEGYEEMDMNQDLEY